MPTQWYNQQGPAAIPHSQGPMNQMHHSRFHHGGVGAPAMNPAHSQAYHHRNPPPMTRPPFTASAPSYNTADRPALGHAAANQNKGVPAMKTPAGVPPHGHFNQGRGVRPMGLYPMPPRNNSHLIRPNPRGPTMQRHHPMGPHGTIGQPQGNVANSHFRNISNGSGRGAILPNRAHVPHHFGGSHHMVQTHHMHQRGPHHRGLPMGGAPHYHGATSARSGVGVHYHGHVHPEQKFQRVPSRNSQSSPTSTSIDHGALRQTPSPPPAPPTMTTSASRAETKTSESPAMVERVVSEDSISPTASTTSNPLQERHPNQMEAKTEAASILLQLGSMLKKTDTSQYQDTATPAPAVSPSNTVPDCIEESKSCDRSEMTDESSPDLTSEPSNDSADTTGTVESDFPALIPENYPKRLALPFDESKLNSLHCYLRSELLEIFVVERSQTKSPTHSPGSSVGRVGLRCVHCAISRKQREDRDEAPMAVFYPKSIAEIYRLVTSWQRCHLRKCRSLPPSVRAQWQALRDSDKSRGKTHYWVTSAKQIGLVDCVSRAGGVRFRPDAIASSSPKSGAPADSIESSETKATAGTDSAMDEASVVRTD